MERPNSKTDLDWEEVKARLEESIKRLGQYCECDGGYAHTAGYTIPECGACTEAADIRAALQRSDDLDQMIDKAGDWIETDPSLRSSACIEAVLNHAKWLDSEVVDLRQRILGLEFKLSHECEAHLKSQCECAALRQRVNDLENCCMVHNDEYADLRQRVEKLERELDEAEREYTEQRCRAEAAEAKLAEIGRAGHVTCFVAVDDMRRRAEAAEAKLARVVEELTYAFDQHGCFCGSDDNADWTHGKKWVHHACCPVGVAIDMARGGE